jgi:hypothetical protein
MRNARKVPARNLTERGFLDDTGVYGGMMLKWVLEKCVVKLWMGFKWLKIQLYGILL